MNSDEFLIVELGEWCSLLEAKASVINPVLIVGSLSPTYKNAHQHNLSILDDRHRITPEPSCMVPAWDLQT